ncbi:MAG: hypothetical protein WDZ49_10335 [Litorilinea sp.]
MYWRKSQAKTRVWGRAGLRLVAGMALAWVGLLVTTLSAWAAPLTQDLDRSDSIWPVLLPLGAASIALERSIEIVWNYVDWLLLNMRGWRAADLKSAQYVQFKSGTSLVLGMVIGILIANYTGMRLFDYLRPLAPSFLEVVPPFWDVIITGLILGAGAKPTHDFLGIITQTKNLLGNSAVKQRELAASAMADGVLKLAQSDAQAMLDVPGVGPARLSTPGGRDDDDDHAPLERSQADQYIDTLRDRTVY